jgi:DNA-binding transcriptional ArsR family regulator
MVSTIDSPHKHSFDTACALIAQALAEPARRAIVERLVDAKDLGEALRRLRDSFQSHTFMVGGESIDLAPAIKKLDSRTRADGFHVLHDWDGMADQVNEETIPVDVLNYLIAKRGAEPADARVLHILLDYYYLHLLALLSVRIWDNGNGDENLDRVGRLLDALQGPGGSGQMFTANAETLILIATSHFELHERGYGTLLEKVRTLNRVHQTNIALGHAASMGSHLRFGFEATYARDTVAMRDDNVADYPWLCFALVSVMREYSRLYDAGVTGLERERTIEALLNGLSADARAFVGAPPPSLASSDVERSEFAERFRQHKDDVLAECERHLPADGAYSPLSFFFNFSHNVLKGTVVDALLRGQPWTVTFNDLLTGLPRDPDVNAQRLELATTLMGYARTNPNRIRGRLMPVIVYDPDAGRRAFAITMAKVDQEPAR